MKELVAPTLSTHEVAALIGCSYRQLDYWVRRGLIPGQDPVGRGSGSRRAWKPRDIQRARMVALASKLSNQPLEKTVEMLETEFDLQFLAMELEATA